MVICLIGDEYSINKKVNEKCKSIGMLNCIVTDDANEAISSILMPPVLSDEKGVVYKGSLAELDCPELHDFIDRKISDTFLFLLPSKNYKNTKLFKKLNESNCVCELKKYNMAQLKQFILKRVSFENEDALSVYLNKTSWVEDGGKSLYEIENELVLLSGLNRTITTADVENLIAESSFSNVFKLIELLEAGNLSILLKEVDKSLTNGKNGLELLGLLRRYYRLSYKVSELKASKEEIGVSYIKPYDNAKNKLHIINNYSESVRNGNLSDIQALKLCLFALAKERKG